MPLSKEKAFLPPQSVSRKLKVLTAILTFIFVYGTLGHMIIFGASPLDALAGTIKTLVLQHKPAPSFIGEAFQISIMLFGVVSFWWAIWNSFDYALEGKFKQYFSEVKTMSDITKLRDHYIICGAGRVGIHTAKLLALEKKPFVLIDMHDEDVENANKRGFLVVKGDPFEEDTLIRGGLTRAKAVIAVMSETEKNILATLIAKQVNPHVKVYARTEKEELIDTLKKVGADHVIMPEAAGALDIIRAIGRDGKDEKDDMKAIKEKVGKPPGF